MARPGLALETTKGTKPILIWRGERLIGQRMPVGTHVIYPPEPESPVASPTAIIAASLDRPIDGDNLQSRLRADMKLTIAFDGNPSCLVRKPDADNRQQVLEAVLEMAATCGVDDVELVVARGLNRRLTDLELRQMLGDRIFGSFVPKGWLTQHDAENPDALETIGTTADSEPVEINRRVAQSDLLIYVGVSNNTGDGGWRSLLTGLGSASVNRSLRSHHDDSSMNRMASVLEAALPVFQIETTVGGQFFSDRFGFLNKREPDWSLIDRVEFEAATVITDLTPSRLTRPAWQSIRSPQTLIDVHAGSVQAAHQAAMESLTRCTTTTVESQVDVVSMDVSFNGPFSAGAALNPLLALYSALGDALNPQRGVQIVRDGGVVIVHHPLAPQFSTVHHPSHIDFYDNALTQSTDIKELESNLEDRFATDTWYTQLYRHAYAYHGTQPFALWRACAEVRSRLSGVIFVGANSAAVDRLGVKGSSNFGDALEMARDLLQKPDPTLAHMHGPSRFSVNVR